MDHMMSGGTDGHMKMSGGTDGSHEDVRRDRWIT